MTVCAEWKAIAVAVLVACGACGSRDRVSRAFDSAGGPAHEHHAPHGGTLVELGEEVAHLEVLLDSATGSLTIYALDDEAESSVRVRAPRIDVMVAAPGQSPRPIALVAVASPLTGDTEEESTEFRGSLDLLRGLPSVVGIIGEVVVRGNVYRDVSFTCPAQTPAG